MPNTDSGLSRRIKKQERQSRNYNYQRPDRESSEWVPKGLLGRILVVDHERCESIPEDWFRPLDSFDEQGDTCQSGLRTLSFLNRFQREQCDEELIQVPARRRNKVQDHRRLHEVLLRAVATSCITDSRRGSRRWFLRNQKPHFCRIDGAIHQLREVQTKDIRQPTVLYWSSLWFTHCWRYLLRGHARAIRGRLLWAYEAVNAVRAVLNLCLINSICCIQCIQKSLSKQSSRHRWW